MAEIKAVEKSAESAAAKSGGMTAPYFDLDASIKVAEVIHNKGGGACTPDQLAHWLDYSTIRSGTYLTRVSSANKHFGLIDVEGDRLVVTERANKILSPVMPEDAINAKADAFLAVPLFGKVYEEFRGRGIPPEVGLKNLFQSKYKMVPDRAAAAVRIFMSSAQQAGLLTADRSRLIRPATSATAAPKPENKEEQPAPEKPKGGGGSDGGTGGVHSAIIGLLRELPPPGSPWPGKKRFKEAFMATLDFIYPEENAP